MSEGRMLSAYFSHSWRPAHLPLNLALWERISRNCHLIIDQPVQLTRDKHPPYYISRIESLMRRSDAFVACMPPTTSAPDGSKAGDWNTRCSPYILFEIRLAERLNIPRFILFDRESGFRPPTQIGPHVRYVPCRMTEVIAKIGGGSQRQSFIDELDSWLAWLNQHASPSLESDNFSWARLLGDDASSLNSCHLIESAVKAANFEPPADLSSCRNDAELSLLVRSLSLLVVDVSSPQTMPLYHFAHANMVPCIRLHPNTNQTTDAFLPSLLRGHPAGYQQDLVSIPTDDSVCREITLRAQAVTRNATPITSLEDGRYEIQQRGYKKHMVFISHDLKPPQRELVTKIAEACRRDGIDFWEYEERNRAGEHWQRNLDEALNTMTHFIALLSPTYEQSVMCAMELKQATVRGNDVVILPFLLGTRQRPNVELRNRNNEPAHHQRLFDEKSVTENASVVIEEILKHIQR